MDLKSLSEIKYLKRKYPQILLGIIKVIDGLKQGYYLELSEPIDYEELFFNLKLLSSKKGLYFTKKNNCYITRNKELLNEWESLSDNKIPGKFLGYPSCCSKAFELMFSKGVTLIRELYWYYLIAVKSSQELINYAMITSYVDYYPCSFECAETKVISEKTKILINKHRSLITKDFERNLYRKRINSIKRKARDIIKAINEDSFKKELINPDKTIKMLKDKGLFELLKIKSDFKKVISDLFNNRELSRSIVNNKLKSSFLSNNY